MIWQFRVTLWTYQIFPLPVLTSVYLYGRSFNIGRTTLTYTLPPPMFALASEVFPSLSAHLLDLLSRLHSLRSLSR